MINEAYDTFNNEFISRFIDEFEEKYKIYIERLAAQKYKKNFTNDEEKKNTMGAEND